MTEIRDSVLTRTVLIGCSAGGLEPLRLILDGLPADFPAPVIVISHAGQCEQYFLPAILGHTCLLPVQEATERSKVMAGRVYIAPPDYHLLIETNRTFTLNVDEQINYSRPAIDVSFVSAAETYKSHTIGVILSGANTDGAMGLKMIHDHGGLTLVQNPETTFAKIMPLASVPYADHVLTPMQIMQTIVQECTRPYVVL